MIRQTFFIKAQPKPVEIKTHQELSDLLAYMEANKQHYKGSNLEKSAKKLQAQFDLIEDAQIEE